MGPGKGLALIKQYENIETILEGWRKKCSISCDLIEYNLFTFFLHQNFGVVKTGSKHKAPCENWQYREARLMFKNSQEHQPLETPSLDFKAPQIKSLNDLLLDFTVPDKRIDHYLNRIGKLGS